MTYDNAAKANQAAKAKYDAQRILTAKYTLRVKNAVANANPPAVTTTVMPKSSVRPTGGAKVVLPPSYRTWDAPGITQKRKKLLAAIGNQFPQLYVPGEDNPTNNDPHGKVPYQKMTNWNPGKGTSCTASNSLFEFAFTGVEGKWEFFAYALQEAWVPWGANPAKPMPSVGDIYLLYRDIVEDTKGKAEDEPHTRHCGIIVQVPESPKEIWITADGGQTHGEVRGGAAYLNRRPWEKRVPGQTDPRKKSVWEHAMKAHRFAAPIQGIEYPYLGGGAESVNGLADANRLIGWLDLDSPAIQFRKTETFDQPRANPKKIRQLGYTEYDYQFLGAWIDELTGKRPGALAGWLAHLRNPATDPPWKPTP